MMKMTDKQQRFSRGAVRGFTMVELLVAMAISSFIIVTVFYVMTSSSRTFRVQSDVSQVSDRINFALDTVKSDLRRTSFMSVPNAYLPRDQYPWYRQVCAPPPWMASATGFGPAAHAIWVREGSGAGLDYYAPDAEEAILDDEQPDQLVLLGAFRADRAFRPTQMQSGTNSITVSNGTGADAFTDAQMRYMFRDAMISVATPAGGIQFMSVTDVTAHPVLSETILTLGQLLQADPTGTGLETCNFTGFGGGTFEVVPLHFVRYSVAVDPDDQESTVLVREELNFQEQTLWIANRQIVARDIVDLQVWFDGVAALGDPNDVVIDGEGSGDITDDGGSLAANLVAGDGNAQPENARHAYVQVSARLDTPITRFRPEGSGVGLAEFIELVDCNPDGQCVDTGEFTRVVTMRSEVDMPNIALANVRTGP